MNILKRDGLNDYTGCLEVIETLTNTIDNLYELASGTLSGDPFNNTFEVDNALRKLGVSEHFFADTAEKLSLFRSLLAGDCLNWQELVSIDSETVKIKPDTEK